MTKHLITSLLILVTIVSFGQQTLSGTFCDFENWYGGECLTLSDSGTFILDGTSCFGNYFGKGTFEFKKDTLKIKFLDIDNQANIIKILQEDHSKNDTSIVLLITKDKNQEIVPFTEVFFYQNKPIDKDVPIFKSSTDEIGRLRTLISKSDKIEFVKIWYIGTNPVVKKIKVGYDYLIQAEINMSDTSFITSGIREYKFKKINTNSIELGRLNSENLEMIKMERIKKH
jgi:hypothetical protein